MSYGLDNYPKCNITPAVDSETILLYFILFVHFLKIYVNYSWIFSRCKVEKDVIPPLDARCCKMVLSKL